jgi:hypothetical protein
MSRFFAIGPFAFGVVARLAAAVFALARAAVVFLAVVFFEVAVLLISTPEGARPFYSFPRPTQARSRGQRPRRGETAALRRVVHYLRK